MTDAYDSSLVLDFPFFSGVDTSLGGTDGAIRNRSGYGNHGFPVNFVGQPGAMTDVEFVDAEFGQGVQLVDPKYINFGAILDFTVEPFTFEMVVNPSTLANDPVIIFKGATSVDGYNCQLVGASTDIRFRTNQGGANQGTQTNAGALLLNNRNHIFITRNLDRVRIYTAGAEQTYAAVGVHVNPLTSANNLRLSTFQGAPGFGLSGVVSRFRAWSRLMGAAEIFERTQYAAMR